MNGYDTRAWTGTGHGSMTGPPHYSRQAGRQAGRQADRQAGRQAGPAGRQAGRPIRNEPADHSCADAALYVTSRPGGVHLLVTHASSMPAVSTQQPNSEKVHRDIATGATMLSRDLLLRRIQINPARCINETGPKIYASAVKKRL
jgi:hypothetical protein